MDTKKKIIKMANVCYIISKALYLLSFVVCLTFIVLAIVLPNTNAITSMTKTETAVLFGTLALYTFFYIGLLWNVESLFKMILKEQSPFNDGVSHYLMKIAVFIILTSVVPALAGSICLRLMCMETEMTFPIEVGGIVAGLVLFLLGMFFTYGKELQKKDDETL